MKKITILFFLSIFSFSLLAAIKISGKVLNVSSQSPMEFVNVVLFEPNNKTPLKKVDTDNNGVFNMPVEANKKYVLKFNFTGYKTVKLNIVVADESKNVGVVKMEEKSEHLSEVEVLGQGSQMHFDIDKKVFSVDRNIASAGGSVTDVLKNIPSVDVDVEGNISLRNDDNVEVWINGKSAGLTSANRSQILEQMPAEDVKSIEIISNPSAKYSASGTAGIINLVLKENKKPGYYGGVMTGITRSSGGKIGGLLGANISYSNKKFDVYADLGFRDVVKQGYGWTDRYRMNGGDTTKLRKDNSKYHETKTPFIRYGIDYRFNDKNSIGLSGFGLFSNESSDNTIRYVKTLVSDNSILKRYIRDNTQNGDHPNVHLSLDFRHDFKEKGSNLKASITYARHKTGGDYEFLQTDSFPNLSMSDILQNSVNISSHWNFKVDYTRQFSKISKLEAGWHSKLSHSQDEAYGINKLTGDSIDSFYDKFNYTEQIHAGYVTYSNKIKNLCFLTGMRGEYISYISTNNTATYVQNNPRQSYFQLFPSLFLSYSLPNRNEFQLNYTRRINRPQASEINPFHDYSDANDIKYGNAKLMPEYAASMELNYIKIWDNHTLSASLYYKYIDNVIEDVSFVSPLSSDIMENTYMNISHSKKAGLELIGKDKLFKILDLTSALNIYYNKIDSAVYKEAVSTMKTAVSGQDNFSWTAKIIANVMICKGFSGQVIGEYASEKIIPQGKRRPSHSIDMGLLKTFFNRSLAVSLTFRDVLNSDRKKSTTSGVGFYETTEYIPHGRALKLTVSYNFGNMKSKKRTELEKKKDELPYIDSDDEIE